MTKNLYTHTQVGQATTEFVVLAAVLVPLFIAVPLLGKYLDLMQTTEAASRYVAFEGTVQNTSTAWKPNEQLAQEVRRRFFSNSDAPIKTNDVAGDFAAYRNPLWSDHKGNALLQAFASDVTQSSTRSSPTIFREVAGVPLGNTLDRYIQSGLRLSYNNLNVGQVTVRPANIPGFAPFDALNLSITRRTVVLTDAWTGRSPETVRAKIQNAGWFVYPIADPVVGLIYDAAGMLPPVLTDDQARPGLPRWDVVPNDRIR